MLENGFIKLYRTMLKWRWYDDINTKILFIHLLLTVNYEDKDWRDITVKRGQRVCSLQRLAKELKITVKQVRTALNHLERTQEVAKSTTAKYTVITINNYDEYQEQGIVEGKQRANKGQGEGKQRANKGQTKGNNERKIKKDKESNKKDKEYNKDLLPDAETAPDSKTDENENRFDEFWKSYPKKVGKGAAEKAYKKIKPTSDLQSQILSAVEKAKQTEQWRKQNGQFIPYPATWLNQKRWEDEYQESVSGLESSFDTDEFFEAAVKRSMRE